MEIFPLEYGFGDFSFEIFPFVKICLWRFFLEDLFWSLNFWKNFNEDLLMEIFPWRFILRYFSIEVLEIFIEDLFIGVFSFGIWFWRFFLLNISSWRFFLEDLFWILNFWKNLMKICSWRFFLWNMVLEIFPFEDLFVEIFPWRFILGIELLKKF